jgi:hypothetical protein
MALGDGIKTCRACAFHRHKKPTSNPFAAFQKFGADVSCLRS